MVGGDSPGPSHASLVLVLGTRGSQSGNAASQGCTDQVGAGQVHEDRDLARAWPSRCLAWCRCLGDECMRAGSLSYSVGQE